MRRNPAGFSFSDMDLVSAPDAAQAKATRRTLGLVFLTVFMDFLGFSILFPIFPKLLTYYFEKEPDGTLLHGMLSVAHNIAGDGNPVAVAALFGGVLGSLFSLLQFVCAPLWGKLSDRIGRRRVLLMTLSGTAVAYALWVFAGMFWVVVLSRALAGIMAGNISVASAAAADATKGRDRSKAMATVGIGIAAGILFGPAIGAITSLHDISKSAPAAMAFALNPFSLAAITAFVMASLNVFFAFRWFKETLPVENRSVASTTPRASIFSLGRLGSPDIRRATLVNLFFFTAFAGMESTLTFVALDLFNYTPGENAIMFTFIAVSLGLIQGGIVRRMGSRIGEKRMAIAGLVAGVFAFLVIAAIPHPAAGATLSHAMGWVFYAGLFLFAAASALTQPSLSALVSLYSDERTQGYHAGVFRSGGALARAVGPLAAALVYFKTGGHSWVFGAGAVLSLMPLTLAFSLRQPSHSAKAE